MVLQGVICYNKPHYYTDLQFCIGSKYENVHEKAEGQRL